MEMPRRSRRRFGELEVGQLVSREQRCQGEERASTRRHQTSSSPFGNHSPERPRGADRRCCRRGAKSPALSPSFSFSGPWGMLSARRGSWQSPRAPWAGFVFAASHLED